jgi:hypothetical protein
MKRSNLLLAGLAGFAAMALVTVMVSMTADALTVKLMQILAPLPTKDTRPTLGWNGLPEGYRFDPFVDLEHPYDRIGKNNPWSATVCFSS